MRHTSYVIRRDKRTILATLPTYEATIRYDWSHQNKFGSIDQTLGGRQPYPAWASFGIVDMVFKPRVSAFQNCAQRDMGHNIVWDIALATKLVILWTGISVYTSIPVNRYRKAIESQQESYMEMMSR